MPQNDNANKAAKEINQAKQRYVAEVKQIRDKYNQTQENSQNGQQQ